MINIYIYISCLSFWCQFIHIVLQLYLYIYIYTKNLNHDDDGFVDKTRSVKIDLTEALKKMDPRIICIKTPQLWQLFAVFVGSFD